MRLIRKLTSKRFFRILASLSAEPDRTDEYLRVLRGDRWLDKWLLHDWLDYTGRYLIRKYKSHNRKRLVAIWRKHGRVYGAGGEDDPEGGKGSGKGGGGADGKNETGREGRGTGREASGTGPEPKGKRPGRKRAQQHTKTSSPPSCPFSVSTG